MAYAAPSSAVQKVQIAPINLVFRFLQNKTRVAFWLNCNRKLTIEGVIVGFDEFMNLTVSDAEEVYTNSTKQTRKNVGNILIKGNAISAVVKAPEKDVPYELLTQEIPT